MIGALDSKYPDNERPEYTALITGFQIRIRRGARSFQMRSGFMKRSQNFNNSQELKGQSEKLKNPYLFLVRT
jgi:hypothetical protein